MKCPDCEGHGGSSDYWGEWSECPCCDGSGKCSKEHYDNYIANLKAADDEIDRQMRAPCPKCGKIMGNHINREDLPCETV